MKTIAIDGYSLALGFEDAEPRVRDLELAKHLGYEKPINIRKLVRKLAAEGRLGIVSSQEIIRSGAGRPGFEFWLTEAQALKVAAKSETAEADKVLDELIRVYQEVRQITRAPLALDVSGLDERLARMEAKQDRSDASLAVLWTHISQGGYIARARFEALRAEWQELADLEVAVGRWPDRRAALADIQRDMREAADWGGKGKPWAELPAAMEPAVRAVLKRRRKDALHRSPPPKPQLSLIKVS